MEIWFVFTTKCQQYYLIILYMIRKTPPYYCGGHAIILFWSA